MGQESTEHILVDKREFAVRGVNIKDDYAQIQKLWDTNKATSPPISVFSQRGKCPAPHGIIVSYKNVAICTVFMYHTGASMCMMEFMVCRSDAPREYRDPALNMMLNAGVAWAKKHKYEFIYTATSSPKFMQRLDSIGFIKKGSPQQHYFWGLNG